MLVRNDSAAGRSNRTYFDAVSNPYALRVAVLLAALVILFFRLPTYFSYPQFWAEDGLAWLQTRTAGVESIVMPMAGYMLVVMHIITLAAAALPIAWAPAVYFYSATAITLAIIWLVMSPRFDIPFRPLAAIAIVISYQGIYALGSVANLQWILPIGACAIILMRRARSKFIFAGEMIFIGLMSVTGPFSILLMPAIGLRLLVAKQVRSFRQFAFFGIVATGAIIQISSMYINRDATFTSGEHISATLPMIVNMPLHQLFSPIGGYIFSGYIGVIATAAVAASILWLSLTSPYRMEKIFIILFSALLFTAAVVKSGIDLSPSYGLRYFYIPSVLAVWFAMFASASLARPLLVAIPTALFQLLAMVLTFNTGSIHGDFQWVAWSTAIESGLPVTLPIAPAPWHLNVPASPSGQLHYMNDWIGKPIGSVSKIASQHCDGKITTIEPFNEPNFGNVPGSNIYRADVPRWRIEGETSITDTRFVIMADSESRVLGFGFTGFPLGAPKTEKWIGVVPNTPGDAITTYRVNVRENTVCAMTSIGVPIAR